jgi:hypothetical protein
VTVSGASESLQKRRLPQSLLLSLVRKCRGQLPAFEKLVQDIDIPVRDRQVEDFVLHLTGRKFDALKKGDALFSASPFLEPGDRYLVIGPLQRRAA